MLIKLRIAKSGTIVTMLNSAELKAGLRQKARDLGFSFVGVIAALPSPRLAAYQHWIGQSMHGEMSYLARPDRQIRREDLNVILPGVQTMICVGLDYFSQKLPEAVATDPSRGRLSNYAWQVDYHDVMTPRLKELGVWLAEQTSEAVSNRVYVDTGAILERSHAQQAGFGFEGKNTMLIAPRSGSYFFLGELLTTLALVPDEPPALQVGCGSCTRCLNDCPTDAFPQPFVLDARRCISYLTIELKGMIPREFRPKMGNWIYGCDICQDVCPWNRFAKSTAEMSFHQSDIERMAPKLQSLLTLTNEQFNMRFANSPIKRIKRRRLIRNACIAAGNWQSLEPVKELMLLLSDEEPLIRASAAWALGQKRQPSIVDALAAALNDENDEAVRRELHLAIA